MYVVETEICTNVEFEDFMCIFCMCSTLKTPKYTNFRKFQIFWHIVHIQFVQFYYNLKFSKHPYYTWNLNVLGGYNLCDLDPGWFRQKISMVSQEPTLFACSIKDNIAYGRQASLDEVRCSWKGLLAMCINHAVCDIIFCIGS